MPSRDKKWWIALATVVLGSFVVLLYMGMRIDHSKPPVPTSVVAADGTQLILPAAAGRVSRPEGTADMTAGDLVAALRAHASGADTSAVLGSEINWQRVCAALLSILLRKQLIADWEFVDELRR